MCPVRCVTYVSGRSVGFNPETCIEASESIHFETSGPLIWRSSGFMIHKLRKKSCQGRREKLGALRIEMEFIGLVIPH
jgi:hypothetical protein